MKIKQLKRNTDSARYRYTAICRFFQGEPNSRLKLGDARQRRIHQAFAHGVKNNV